MFIIKSVRFIVAFLLSAVIFMPLALSLEKFELSNILEEARRNNPMIKAAEEDLKAAAARVGQASALPDPSAGTAIMGRDIMTVNGPEEDIYNFEQMVPFPGKLWEKRKAAQMEVEATAANLESTQREIAFKVKETYYDLMALQETLKILRETKNVLLKFEEITQSRYASQNVTQRDVAKAQGEISDILEKIFRGEQQQRTLLAYLRALLNRHEEFEIDDIPLPALPSLSSSLEDLSLRLKKNPEVKQKEALVAKEKKQINLARYENVPDFSIGLEYSRIGRGETTQLDDGKDAWMIPIKITLPIWQNRIGAGIKEAKSNLHLSEQNLKSTANQIEYELKDAFYRFQSKKELVRLYQTATIPQAKLAFNSDEAGYEAGKVDILNLIDSERIYLTTRIGYYESLSEAWKSLSEIEEIVGEEK